MILKVYAYEETPIALFSSFCQLKRLRPDSIKRGKKSTIQYALPAMVKISKGQQGSILKMPNGSTVTLLNQFSQQLRKDFRKGHDSFWDNV